MVITISRSELTVVLPLSVSRAGVRRVRAA
jgi:hypothetical protein